MPPACWIDGHSLTSLLRAAATAMTLPNTLTRSTKVTFNPSRVKNLTTAYVDKVIAAGLGKGVLQEYRPWIEVGSFGSKGSSHVVKGITVPRKHHLLSDAELGFFTLMEFNPEVVDIREQFPLLEYFETYEIAIKKNIKPAQYFNSDVPYVYTTDFMLTLQNDLTETSFCAISLKYRAQLAEAKEAVRIRIIEKLEIEEEYWSRRNITWSSVFYEDLPQVRIANLIAIKRHALTGASLGTPKNLELALEFFDKLTLNSAKSLPLNILLSKLSSYMYMNYLDVKRLFFFMVWSGLIPLDLDRNRITMTTTVQMKPDSRGYFNRSLGGVADEFPRKHATGSA